MAVIAINTCEAACSVLVQAGDKHAFRREAMRTGHDRVLPALVRQALDEAGCAMTDLSEVVVATGPGSFTGSRIGVAFARGLGVALGIPVKGVNLLHALAMQMAGSGRRGLAVRNVGRGQLGWCAVQDGELVLAPESGSEDELRSALDDPQWLASLERETPAETDMTVLARLGLELTIAKAPANAWYARPPDAKLPGGVDPW